MATRFSRTRTPPAPLKGPIRGDQKSLYIGDPGFDYSVFFKEGDEHAHYTVRLNLSGKHPDWYDSSRIIMEVLKKAEAEINSKITGGRAYFDMVYSTGETIDKYLPNAKWRKAT